MLDKCHLFLRLLNLRGKKAKLPFCADLPYRFCEDSQPSVSVWPFWGKTTHTQQ